MISIKDFTEAMGASLPVALAIFIGSTCVLIGEAIGIRYLDSLPDWLLGLAFLAAAFSGAIVVVAILRWMGELVRLPFLHRRAKKLVDAHIAGLDELPMEERHVLVWAARKNTQVFLAPANHDRLEPLLAKGYVEMVPGMHSILEWPHRVPDHIWKAVQQKVANLPPDTIVPDPFERRW